MMRQQPRRIALLGVAALGCALAATAQPREASNHIAITGSVVEVYSRRLFLMREVETGGRQLFVVAPRSLSVPLQDATVRVEGTLRRLSAAELKQVTTPDAAGEQLRSRLADRVVLVATSVLATMEGRAAPPVAEPPAAPEAREPERQVVALPPPVLTLRASVLMADPDGFAGRLVRILNARVVGVLEPGAFLVEPATNFLKDMGNRDRLVVLIRGGELSTPPTLVVGEVVIVEGVARTLLSVRVTREVAWPARLEPETIKRLEVRAALVATSVQTPEGTELIR